MKRRKLLVGMMVIFAILLFGCSSKKTTEKNPEDTFLEDLARAEYVIFLGTETFFGMPYGLVSITCNFPSETEPELTLKVNDEIVLIEWWKDELVWEGFIEKIFDFQSGDDVAVQVTTSNRTVNQILRIPHKPQIDETNFPPESQTDFILNWQLSQNADLQIVFAEAYTYDSDEYYNKAINRSHRSHVIPGKTFPVDMWYWYIDVMNVAWKINGNIAFAGLTFDFNDEDLFDAQTNKQAIQSRFREVYQQIIRD